ncbi:defective proboscis extension response dpr -related [Holotrichia oblita]|uniref:Defective proboscis extension response dpr -related n=1 Tax=Holotrichia oblita TaxID=644536 RepID=A0ACB9TIE9_HOLOL|nr:defective proboscis extension response dpr -related [Holotrichia oblita]
MLSFFQDWTLQIKYVQKRDAGLYECQVSSHPPTSIFIELNVVAISETWLRRDVDSGDIALNGFSLIRQDRSDGRRAGGVAIYIRNNIVYSVLNTTATAFEHLWLKISVGNVDVVVGVVYRAPNTDFNNFAIAFENVLFDCILNAHEVIILEARAEISGPSEKYLKPGSGLRLQCTVLQSTEAPAYVFWYHNNRMINYDVDRGINVTTELLAKTSTLTITSAATRHSGNYSCVPSNAQPASTYVHILNGK